MTVGEVIGLLCKQASDKDIYLMRKSIYSIDVNDEGICLCFTDGNTEDYSIKVENKNMKMTLEETKGHWIAYTDHQACSCCGNWIAYYENYKFCPYCGEKMAESKTEQALAYADQDTLMSAT